MIRRRIVHELLRSVKTYSKMNGHLLLALSSVCWCGFQYSSAIKGGEPIKGRGRGLVVIYQGNTIVCQGVTLNRNWVLTAGKCIDDSVQNYYGYRLSFRVRGGKNVDRTISYTEIRSSGFITSVGNFDPTPPCRMSHALKKKTRKVVMLQKLAPNDYRNCKLYATSMGERVYSRLTNVNATCYNETFNSSLCFDTDAYICNYESGSPVWCQKSKSVFLAALATDIQSGCSTSGRFGIPIVAYEPWIRQVLNPVDCGAPPTISNGQLVLFEQGKTTSGAKASVNCDLGYSPTAIEVSCGDDGNWILAQCLLSPA